MISQALAWVCIAVLLCSPMNALARGVDFDQGVDAKAVLESVREDGPAVPAVGQAVPAEAEKSAAEWTIMVFINAKNNLSYYGTKDVNEMETVGSTDKVNVVVELGQRGNTRRMLVRKDEDAGTITSPVLQKLDNSDMGDWRHLVDFGLWAKNNYPAKKYMLVVWNHGSGWTRGEDAVFGTRGISYDDETGHHITTQELDQALAALSPIDVYGSDACLMQMAEVAYEVKDHAGVVVGSEETEPGDGWAYEGFLRAVTGTPGMGAEAVADAVVRSYADYYDAQGQGTTQSALRPEAFEGLVPLLNAWTSAVMAAEETDVVKSARSSVQSFYESDNIDLLHFVRLVDEKTADAAVKAAGAPLMRYIKEKFVASNAVSGSGYEQSGGLAVYLPRYGVSGDYAALRWAQETNWDDFAKWMTAHRVPDKT